MFIVFIILGIILPSGMLGFYFYRQNHPLIIKKLPPLMQFTNGTQVTTIEEWTVRRLEIIDLIEDEEYGHMPSRPDHIIATEISSETFNENGTLEIISLRITPDNASIEDFFEFTIWVYLPDQLPEPFTTFVKVSPDGTGRQEPIATTMLAEGYLFVCYNHTELDPDTEGYDVEGPCQTLYPSYDWGSIAVWAWGAMRVADFLLKEIWMSSSILMPEVDQNRLVVIGHSRRGKTALLAGALDTRFAAVDPNGSGCGGAGSFLIQGPFCERIRGLTLESKFKSWFNENFTKYSQNEIALTFDQHFLRALVAPRAIINTEGKGDFWSNPAGTQVIYQASQPIFDLYNVSGNNAIYYRNGGHGFLEEDFNALFEFCKVIFDGKSTSLNLYMTPYNIDLEKCGI